PARPKQGRDRAPWNAEADVIQGLHRACARAIRLAQLYRADSVVHTQPSRALDGSMRMTWARPSMLARVTMTMVAMGATKEMVSVISTRRGNMGKTSSPMT